MKTFAFGLILVVLFTCHKSSLAMTDEEAKAATVKLMDECIKESGVTDAQSKLIHEDKLDDIAAKDFTPQMKCFLLCFYKKLGLVDATGKPNADKLVTFMEARFEDKKDKIKPAMAKCATVTDPNPCEMVFKFEECMSKIIEGK